MFCVVLSLKVPVATNGWVIPKEIMGIAGVTAIETNVAGVTVAIVEPVIEPTVAEILLPPGATLVNRP